MRDWSEEGAEERRQSYGRMLELLERAVPPPARVLVPGAGLGRLVFECFRRGYEVEGNEWSYYMLFASGMLLNCEPGERWEVHPWALESSNCLRTEHQLRAVGVPDVHPCDVRPPADGGRPGASMSMCAGDFAEVYAAAEVRGSFDAVLTCFFLDTARNVAEYIDVLWHCLRPGGAWINFGPVSTLARPPPRCRRRRARRTRVRRSTDAPP